MTTIIEGQSALIFGGLKSPFNVPPPPIRLAFEAASTHVSTQGTSPTIRDSFKFVKKLKYRVTAEDVAIVKAKCKVNCEKTQANETQVKEQPIKINSVWTEEDQHLSV
jgi:hypothetical protein